MVDTLCINSKNKPSEIPESHWVKEGKRYTVKHVYNMTHPGHKDGPVMGVTLMEISLESLDTIYKAYRIDRFGFKKEDIPALMELMKLCAELNDININLDDLLEEQVLIEEEL